MRYVIEQSLRIFGTNVVAMIAGYLLVAGAMWMAGYVWFRERWRQRKIVPGYPTRSDIQREVYYSAISVFIFALTVVGTWWMALLGWNRIYWNPNQYGRWWFWSSIPVTIVLHDAYFYWTHRMMHSRVLFPRFHHTHHRSLNPSPWAAYAFAPLEAVVQAGILPLAAVLYPLHPLPWAVFMIFQLFINVLIHAGYEILPHSFMNSWISTLLSTPTSHVIHHEYGRDNYGFVFNFWDRWMGTNHARYEERFRAAAAQMP